MKRSKFSEAQIAFVLKQADDGTSVGEVCRKAGISEATYYNWRKKYAGLMPSEMKRLRQLEDENAKLKRLVADLSLDKAMLQDVVSRSRRRPNEVRPTLCGLIGDASWSIMSAVHGRSASAGPAACSGRNDPATIMLAKVPIRPTSSNGSRRSRRRGYGTAIAVSMSYCNAKAGRSTASGFTGFTGRWVCNCARRRRSDG